MIPTLMPKPLHRDIYVGVRTRARLKIKVGGLDGRRAPLAAGPAGRELGRAAALRLVPLLERLYPFSSRSSAFSARALRDFRHEQARLSAMSDVRCRHHLGRVAAARRVARQQRPEPNAARVPSCE